jgi:hypothetical protein
MGSAILEAEPCIANHDSGYPVLMIDPLEKARDVVHAVEHPLETAKDLEREAVEGRSPRTPLIALTGVTLFVGAIFVVLATVTLVLYFVYGGK